MTGDKLTDYPCGEWYLTNCFHPLPPCDKADECEQLVANREHIALRRAVLGEMTPAVAREIYSATAGLCEGMALYNAAGRLHALADVVAKL